MTRLTDGAIKAVLFDLDGTLVDTAPDMVAALQALQREHGIAPVAYDYGRSHVSNGALGLLRIGFPGEEIVVGGSLHAEYLSRYADIVCDRSRVFDGLDELLRALDRAGRPWGVVTNKPASLTEPLLEQLALASRSACIVSGDTVTPRKPHPAPLLHACAVAGFRPKETLYVGDAERDIDAGRRAGMMTVAAAYGYVPADEDPARWGADEIAIDTTELAQIVRKAVNLAS